MKIVRLEAENFKRLVAVNINPDGTVCQITGRKTWNGDDWPVVESVATRDTEQEAEAVVRDLVGEGVEI